MNATMLDHTSRVAGTAVHIGDLVSGPLFTLQRNDMIDEAIALMEDEGIHHLPVTNGRLPVGMVSDRDLLVTVGALLSHERQSTQPGHHPLGPTRVYEIMSVPACTVDRRASMADACRIMVRRRIGALPVLDTDRLIGIVTDTDFLHCFKSHSHPVTASDRPVADWMTAHLTTVRPRETIYTCFRVMRDKHIRHLAVVKGGQLVGMATDRAVRRTLFVNSIELPHGPDGFRDQVHRSQVQSIMETGLVTCRPDETLGIAAARMIQRRRRALPVVDRHRLVGILTETDLLRALAAAHEA